MGSYLPKSKDCIGTVGYLLELWGLHKAVEVLKLKNEAVLEVPVYRNARLSVCAGRYGCVLRHTYHGRAETDPFIELSGKLLERGREGDRNRTFIHEIAHAVCGIREGHSLTWKLVNRTLGGDGKRCHNYSYMQPKRKEPIPVGVCEKCERVIRRRKRFPKGAIFFHKGCGGRILTRSELERLV